MGQFQWMQNIIGRCCCFLLGISLCLLLFPASASVEAVSDDRIRVGSFEGNYNVVNEKGERSGYGYEYLQSIAGYTGWTYEYVTSNWTDCFTQLENGEIDILAGISYTDERAEEMLFSDMPMSEEKYYIYVDVANTDLTAADMDSFVSYFPGYQYRAVGSVFCGQQKPSRYQGNAGCCHAQDQG